MRLTAYQYKMSLYFSSFFGCLSLFFGFISLIFFHAFFTRSPKVIISPPPFSSNTTNSDSLIKQSQQLSSSYTSSSHGYFFFTVKISPMHLVHFWQSAGNQRILVRSQQYISLCIKAYKYVKLLHICVKACKEGYE